MYNILFLTMLVAGSYTHQSNGEKLQYRNIATVQKPCLVTIHTTPYMGQEGNKPGSRTKLDLCYD